MAWAETLNLGVCSKNNGKARKDGCHCQISDCYGEMVQRDKISYVAIVMVRVRKNECLKPEMRRGRGEEGCW